MRYQQQRQDDPDGVHGRAEAQRPRQHLRVARPDGVERAFHLAREPAVLVLGPQQARRHHRRQRQRHDARDEDRARQRERELAEQRAGQPALDADRDVHRRQRDGHGDDRPDQLARAEQRRVVRRPPLADVALDVLDDDDGVVDHQADRQDDRQQRQQVQREAERLHQEHAADQRHRDRDHRHQRRSAATRGTGRSPASRSGRSRSASCTTSWIASSMYAVES